jgi:hypothetical protein
MSAASGGKLSNDFSNRSADRWQLCSTSNEQQRAVDNGGIPKRARRRARATNAWAEIIRA